MRCPQCSSKLKKNSKFCPECGIAIAQEELPAQNKQKTDPIKILLALVALLAIAVVVILLLRGDTNQSLNVIESNPESITETTSDPIAFSDDLSAISIASQSVVKLNCYDKNDDLYAVGSGFACFANNVIVTNYHVIEGNVYRIEASTETGETFPVKFVMISDKERDIAILATVNPHNLSLLQTGSSSSLQKGEKVVAIGSPLGLLNSVSTGVFSGYAEENGTDFLQFTASISSGSSGGALFNNSGEVLGITFASYEAGQNVNLAIPIEYVERLYSVADNSTWVAVTKFYETNPPTYTVNQVLQLGDSLAGTVFYIDAYFQEHKISYFENGNDMKKLAYRISATKTGGNSIIVGYPTISSPDEITHEMLKESVAIYNNSREPGTPMRFRCTFTADNSEYTIYDHNLIKTN